MNNNRSLEYINWLDITENELAAYGEIDLSFPDRIKVMIEEEKAHQKEMKALAEYKPKTLFQWLKSFYRKQPKR